MVPPIARTPRAQSPAALRLAAAPTAGERTTRSTAARTLQAAPPQQRAGVAREAVKIRLHPDVLERVRYWAAGQSLSINEYMALAVEEKIARANGDYDLPTLEIARLNQMIDGYTALSTGVNNLERLVISGFDSLLGLTRGDDYLQDAEDGELTGFAGGGAVGAGLGLAGLGLSDVAFDGGDDVDFGDAPDFGSDAGGVK